MRQTFKDAQRHLAIRWHSETQLVFLVLMGVALRLVAIGSRPMWYDEAIAVLVSRSGVSEIIRSIITPAAGASANIHPPLYFSTLWAWIELFGDSPIAARSLSLFLSVLAMFAIWQISKAFIDRRLSLLAVGLYALAPMQVHYGQEARMYVMLCLFLLVATWAMWHLLQGTTRWTLPVLALSSALALYTQALAVVYLVILYSLPVFLKRRDQIKAVGIAGVLSILLYTPWLIHLPAQLKRVQAGYWVVRPGALELIQTLISFNAGLPLTGIWLPVGLALSVLLFVLLCLRTYQLLRKEYAHRQELWAVIMLAILPVVLLFLISQIWPVYVVRGLLPSGVLYLIWIAMVLSAGVLRRFDRNIITAILGSLFAIGLLNHYQYRGFPYAPFNEMNEYLETQLSADGTVLHSNKLSMLPAYYYGPGLPHVFLADPPGSASDTLSIPTQDVIGIHEAEDIQSVVQEHDQIFFVVFSREIEDYERAGVEGHPGLEFLDQEFDLEELQFFGEIQVHEFIRTRHEQ